MNVTELLCGHNIFVNPRGIVVSNKVSNLYFCPVAPLRFLNKVFWNNDVKLDFCMTRQIGLLDKIVQTQSGIVVIPCHTILKF